MFDFSFIQDNWLFIAKGMGATLGVTLLSLSLAIPLAMIVAAGRRSTVLPFNALSTFYVWLIDGIPLLLQIFFVFLALPQLGFILPGFLGAVFVLAIYYSARLSDILYARFAAGETIESAAWYSLFPKIGHEASGMVKDTTLIATTGFIHDVFWRAQRVGRAEFHMLEAWIIAAIIYLFLVTVISLLFGSRKPRLSTTEPVV